jgi:hypothetical protein
VIMSVAVHSLSSVSRVGLPSHISELGLSGRVD